jgi:hypothetical protein
MMRGADLWVDHFDGRWLVQTREAEFPAFLTPLADGVATIGLLAAP